MTRAHLLIIMPAIFHIIYWIVEKEGQSFREVPVKFLRLLFTHHLDDLVKINRAWLHKEPKVSVLQANTKLVQKKDSAGFFVFIQ